MRSTTAKADAKIAQLDEQLAAVRQHINYFPADFTLEVLADKYRKEEIVVPDYQRPHMWPDGQQSFFIESLLMRIPVPPLFFSDSKGKLEVVDGSQRIRTIVRFLDDELRLTGLKSLKAANNLSFSDLGETLRLRFLSTPIRSFLLSEDTDTETRIDIFKRLNTGGLKLTDAQIRKGGFAGKFYNVVEQCALNTNFIAMTPLERRKDAAQEREELVLRFFAYAERYQEFVHDVANFLNEFVTDKNADPDFDPAEAVTRFEEMVSTVRRLFPHGFAKGPTSKIVPRVRFEAIAVGTHLVTV